MRLARWSVGLLLTSSWDPFQPCPGPGVVQRWGRTLLFQGADASSTPNAGLAARTLSGVKDDDDDDEDRADFGPDEPENLDGLDPGPPLCDVQALAQVGCPREEYGIDWVSFLEEACTHCPFGEVCAPLPDAARLVRQMQEVFEEERPFQCVPGLLAALILSAHYFLVKQDMPEEFRLLLSNNRSIAPFPFYTAQYSLYANMVPLRLMMCDGSLWNEMVNKFVPRVHPENSGKCGMVYDDRNLVYKCRSRRPFSEEGSRKALIQDVKCPDPTSISLDPTLSKKLGKYGSRASVPSESCQNSRGMWREPMSDIHKCILIHIGTILDFRPGQLILDWGSGCGHKLSWAKALFDVDGVGLDVEGGAVAWARQHSAGLFCHADGRQLDWLPNDTFDHVISYAAIYHLSQRDQCQTGIRLLKKLRLQGRAWFGWNQGYAMAAWDWYRCFKNASSFPGLFQADVEAMSKMKVDFQGIEDGFLFAPNADVAGTHFLYQYPAYSIFLTRLA